MAVEISQIERSNVFPTEDEILTIDIDSLKRMLTHRLTEYNIYMRNRNGSVQKQFEVIPIRHFTEVDEPEGLCINEEGNWTNGIEEIDGQEMVNVLAQYACLTHPGISNSYSALLEAESSVQRLISEGKAGGLKAEENFSSLAGDFNSSIQAYVRNNMTDLLTSLRSSMTVAYFKR